MQNHTQGHTQGHAQGPALRHTHTAPASSPKHIATATTTATATAACNARARIAGIALVALITLLALIARALVPHAVLVPHALQSSAAGSSRSLAGNTVDQYGKHQPSLRQPKDLPASRPPYLGTMPNTKRNKSIIEKLTNLNLSHTPEPVLTQIQGDKQELTLKQKNAANKRLLEKRLRARNGKRHQMMEWYHNQTNTKKANYTRMKVKMCKVKVNSTHVDGTHGVNGTKGTNGTNLTKTKMIPCKRKPPQNTTLYCYNQKYKQGTKNGTKWKNELVAAAKIWSRNNSIVLTGGDWAYRATVLNWMAHAENIGMTEYIVLCYGTDMLQLVGSWEDGGHGILVVGCFRIIEFMFMKLVGLFHLHSSKYIVTWSDCDALWLRPFMDDWILPYQHKVDILAQKALHPAIISNKTGSVVCTGLFTVFPSVQSKTLMSGLIRTVRRFAISSDQLLVNNYLKSQGSFKFDGKVEYNDIDAEQVVALPNYTNSKKLVAKVGFLPFGLFPRSRSIVEWGRVQKHNPALWHSKTDKLGQSKIDGMKNASVFALQAGWERLRNASQVSAFVDTSVLTAQRWMGAPDTTTTNTAATSATAAPPAAATAAATTLATTTPPPPTTTTSQPSPDSRLGAEDRAEADRYSAKLLEG
jgi:hypothetical protein